MIVKEHYIDNHKKVVVIDEDESLVIVSDLYPCQVEDLGSSKDFYKVIEVDNVKIITRHVDVPKPFLDGILELVCIDSMNKCFSTSIVLKASHNIENVSEIEKLLKDVTSMYEKCLQNPK